MTSRRIHSPRDIWIHLMLYPTHTLPTAAAPVFVGVGLALHDHVFAFWPALAAFVCSWLVHVGGVFVDVHQLVTRHVEIHEHPELNEAVARGELRAGALRWATLGWFVAALLPGIYLLQVVGPLSIPLGAIGIASAVWYAAGRRSMAELGLADPIFFLMFGVVAVAGTYWVEAKALGAAVALPLSSLVVGLPVGALVTNVLIIDDIRDVEFDRIKGWKTTPVRFGVTWSKREHTALAVLAYLLPIGFAWQWGAWLLLPLVSLPFAVKVEHAVWSAQTREPLIPWTPRSAFLSMAYGALSMVGLALAGR